MDTAAGGTRSSRRSTSRSRRSHPSFSDLRLAPLSVADPKQGNDALPSPRTPGTIDPSTALAYRAYHTSYLAGKSAPSTPGILRSTSRRQQYGGLSRKTSSQDGDDDENTENVDPGYFAYNAVQTASHGGVADHSRGYLDEMPKSMSESGLYHAAKLKGKSRSGNQASSHKQHASVDMRAKRRSHHGGSSSSGRPRSRKGQDRDDDWLSHATMFTTSLLAEGKGQSWVSSHSSTLNLHSYAGKGQISGNGFSSYNVSSDSDFDDALAASIATVKARDRVRSRRTSANLMLPIGLTSDEIDAPLRSPAVSAGWGSRFGSRAASRSNSRRGSRVAITKGLSGLSTPHDSSSAAYRFGAVPTMSRTGDGTSESDAQSEHRDDDDATPKVMPDFVDPSARAEIQASLATVARQQRLREAAQQRDGGYFAGAVASDADDDDEDHSSSDEAEVARLARTPGFGLGGLGILDRLVGLGNFNIDDAVNDDEADLGAAVPSDDDYEDVPRARGVLGDNDATPTAAPPVKKSRGAMPKLLPVRKGNAENAEGQEGEGQGGWRDAAWLLSVASKVLY